MGTPLLEVDSKIGENYNIAPTNTGPINARVVDSSTIPTTVVPLKTVLYADGGTTVPTGDQNGSIASPFATLAAAIAASANFGTINVTPFSYGGPEPTLTFAKSILMRGLGSDTINQPGVATVQVNAGVHVDLQTFDTGVVNADAGAVVNLSNGGIGGLSGTGAFSLDGCLLIGGGATCGTIFAKDSVIVQTITCSGTTATFQNCIFPSTITITFSGSPGQLELDHASYQSFVHSGCTVVNGQITSTDTPIPAELPPPTSQTLGLWASSGAPTTPANTWFGCAFGNELFVAVAALGTGNRVMTSPDGITWTAGTSAADNEWTSVTFGNGLFVAVASSGSGNRVMTSPDGIKWTARASAANNQWTSVTFGNGLFVAVSLDGASRVMTSPDGITWTLRTAAEANSWNSVTFGNNLFVAVSTDGTNRVMTSPNGVQWTARAAAAANTWWSVTYGKGLYVAVSIDGTNRVQTSTNGITWTSRSAASAQTWTAVAYGAGLFVAVGQTGTGVRSMTSPDGVTWTTATSAADNAWAAVTYGNGRFVATSVGGTNRAMAAPLAPASANVRQGSFTLNGATPVLISAPELTLNNFVATTRGLSGGTPGAEPVIALNPGTGFSATGTALDTSSYFYRIL